MAEVIGVRFKNVGKVYYFDPNGNKIAKGAHVIVETARGVECGEVAAGNREVEEHEIVKPLKKVIRVATKADLDQVERNRQKEKQAAEVCQKKIQEHKLDMKLVDVEYTFDNSKILFYFTADGRVDFRDLVKPRCSAPGLSYGRSGCGMKPKCWGDWASAGGLSAAPPFWGSSSRFPSKWPKSRAFPSTPPKSPAPVAG